MAVPDGQQIGFVPAGDWSFPNGTVFVKHFELVTNEITGERKRLETRLLVRDANGGVYGVTYKWRPDNSDAELLAAGLNEDVNIITASGDVRTQKWSYPSRSECLFCHNATANYVLGPHTHQLNGDFTYPSTGRTDNQLRTLAHIGLLNPAPAETEIPTLLRSVAVTNPTAPVQHRMRSWIDANCADCHRPGGYGPGFDARFYSPLPSQNLINSYVSFRDIAGSKLYQRDNSLDGNKMPPVAKNVVHEAAMANLRQWIASPFEVLSVNLYGDTSHLLVRFNSFVDPSTGTIASNYSVDGGVAVIAASAGPQPDTVILAVAPLIQNGSYVLTVNDVQDTAASANTIWPVTKVSFSAIYAEKPTGTRLANISTREWVGSADGVLIGGFIARGAGPKRVMIRALGPSLAPAGISNALSDPMVELHDGSGVLLATNGNWGDNYNRQEIIDTGIAPAAATEPAIVTKLPASENGTPYTIIVRGENGSTGSALLEIYDLDRGVGPSILNISTRGELRDRANVMIGGFINVGAVPQKVLIRALGPSLPVSGQLTDPTVELYDSNGALLQMNDNWKTDQQAEIEATTIPPTRDAEAALIRSLAPGNYTAIVRGANGTAGVALVEVFGLN